MKQKSWLIALALFVACLMGCNKSWAEVTKTQSAGHDSNAAQGGAASLADIAGDYAVVGTYEDGSPYKGALAVIKHGDVYQFRWTAGKQFDGIGIPNGNVVAVAFTSRGDGKGCGVVTYQVLADGTLEGKWGYWGVNESGTEKGTRTTGSALEGEYNTQGTNPNGNTYKGSLVVARQAGGYSFVWSNNTSGFGIRQGDVVSVGLGGPRCAFVAYEIKPHGVLEGIWGGYGSNKTGTEKATRK